MIKKTFKLGSETIPVFLGYRVATTKLEDLGLEILSAMDGSSATVQTILLNDKVMLRVMYFYVQEHNQMEWYDFLDQLDEMDNGLTKFKNLFWEMVLGFLPPQATPALQAMKRYVEKQLKDPDIKMLSGSSTESLEDSESTPETTP